MEGVVERVTYCNEENAWSVVRLLVRGKGEVTAVGNLLGVQPGESLRLEGRWVKDRKYGRQFKVESFRTVKPGTFIGIERYLGSGLIRGIGPALAKRLVKKFGLDTLHVIEHQPGRLKEVEGIGPKRLKRILEAWDEQRGIQEVMVFLQGHGVATSHAVKIYKRYGADAVTAVREDPYRLAREVYGIGFKSADRIARDLGIPDDAPQRARAGVLQILRTATDVGHVFLPRIQLETGAAELLEVQDSVVSPAVDELVAQGDLRVRSLEVGSDAVLLEPLDVAERGAAAMLRSLTAQGTLPLKLDVERAIEWFEGRQSLELAPNQRLALEKALTSKILVLTGGPGTGKTTLVRGIVSILGRKGLRLQMAAPTGRAAKRLAETTGKDAKTLHRLLEWSPQERRFTRDSEHPLNLDLLVVDEASMLDIRLMYHILRALPPEARLILVGDVDQLPSIGPGRVLADLIESRVVEVARLTEIFRQAKESLIIVNAHRVRDGQTPSLRPTDAEGDFFFFEREEPPAILSTLKHLVAERVPRKLGIDPLRDLQVLTPMRRGLLGANNLNVELQELLNPGSQEEAIGGRALRPGDRVMQRRNNYDLEVFNGDIGRVERFDREEKLVVIDFEGRLVSYQYAELDELVLAYACSIHKSQGSEYPAVVIPLHTQHYTLLQRNLLYTAITRGRRLVIVVGSRRALEIAVKTQTSTRRFTLLAERLRSDDAEAS